MNHRRRPAGRTWLCDDDGRSRVRDGDPNHRENPGATVLGHATAADSYGTPGKLAAMLCVRLGKRYATDEEHLDVVW
jgi:hypothetical protein